MYRGGKTDPQFTALCLNPGTELQKRQPNWWLAALSKNGYRLKGAAHLVLMWTDHKNLACMRSIKQLNPCQAGWLFLINDVVIPLSFGNLFLYYFGGTNGAREVFRKLRRHESISFTSHKFVSDDFTIYLGSIRKNSTLPVFQQCQWSPTLLLCLCSLFCHFPMNQSWWKRDSRYNWTTSILQDKFSLEKASNRVTLKIRLGPCCSAWEVVD